MKGFNKMKKLINKEKLNKINEIILSKADKMRKNFDNENMIISVYCYNPDMQPRECANMCNKRYLTSYTGNDVIDIFGGLWMRNITDRKELFFEANRVADLILEALCDNKNAFSELEKRMKANKGRIAKTKSKHFERVALFSLLEASSQISGLPCYKKAFALNTGLSREIFYDIIDVMRLEAKMNNKIRKSYASNLEYEAEINRLETNLNRTALMLERLQAEFDIRVEECKTEENINLISMLNSPKYGYILDLLLQAQHGIESVKRQRIQIPFEINSLPILVRKLLQFTEDCGITPILELGQKMKITASEIEGYHYDGVPFGDNNEIKSVEVISPGWIVEEKQIVISSPRVKEVEE